MLRNRHRVESTRLLAGGPSDGQSRTVAAAVDAGVLTIYGARPRVTPDYVITKRNSEEHAGPGVQNTTCNDTSIANT